MSGKAVSSCWPKQQRQMRASSSVTSGTVAADDSNDELDGDAEVNAPQKIQIKVRLFVGQPRAHGQTEFPDSRYEVFCGARFFKH